MPWTRFHKRFKIFPGVKVNVGKTGISISVGKKGYHLNFSKRGVRQTVGIPGTGISHISYLHKSDSDSEEEKEKKSRNEDKDEAEPIPARKRRTRTEAQSRGSSPWGFFVFTFIAVFLIYVGGVSLGLLPPSNLITQFLQFLSEMTRQVGL
jgi:hypothetical protein